MKIPVLLLIKRMGVPMLALMLVLLISCNKEPDLVGLEVTPSQDKLNIGTCDTATIEVFSLMDDSTMTMNTSLSLAGAYFDPVFGKLVAGFNTQFSLSSENVDFGTNPVLDSLVLTLKYSGSYGDTNSLMTLQVYELADSLYDTTYYAFSRMPHSAVDLAHKTFYPRPSDSVMVDSVNVDPHIRINLSKLSPSLGNKILNATADELENNTTFKRFFKGLFITASPVNYGGSVLYFNLTSDYSGMTLYYHNDSLDSLSYPFGFNSYTWRFNQFEHYNYDYADQNFRKQVVYKDTTLGKNLFYLEATGGVKAKVRFPHIRDFYKSGKIAVNAAELIIPVNTGDGKLPPPVSLYMRRIKDDKTLVYMPEDNAYDHTLIGGDYNSTKKQYLFRLPLYIHDLLSGTLEDNGVYIAVQGSSVQAARTVLQGPGNSSGKMRLKLTYTKLP